MRCAGIEESPVHGPALSLEAENPNVVIRGYLRESPVFRCLLHLNLSSPVGVINHAPSALGSREG